jgi:hypothetical protein
MEGVAEACLCPPPPEPQTAAMKSAAVFEGTLAAVEDRIGEGRLVRLSIGRRWKLPDVKELVIRTGWSELDCGYPFNTCGGTYLVYAAKDCDRLATGLCHRTRPIAQAATDIAALGPPLAGGDPGPMTDVSIVDAGPCTPRDAGPDPDAGTCTFADFAFPPDLNAPPDLKTPSKLPDLRSSDAAIPPADIASASDVGDRPAPSSSGACDVSRSRAPAPLAALVLILTFGGLARLRWQCRRREPSQTARPKLEVRRACAVGGSPRSAHRQTQSRPSDAAR